MFEENKTRSTIRENLTYNYPHEDTNSQIKKLELFAKIAEYVISIIKSIFYVSITYGTIVFFWYYFDSLYAPIISFDTIFVLFVFLPTGMIFGLSLLISFLPDILFDIKLKLKALFEVKTFFEFLSCKILKILLYLVLYLLLQILTISYSGYISYLIISKFIFNELLRKFITITFVVITIVLKLFFNTNKINIEGLIKFFLSFILLFLTLLFLLGNNYLMKIFKLADVPVEIQLKNEFAINNQTIIEGCLISRFGDEVALMVYDNSTNKFSNYTNRIIDSKQDNSFNSKKEQKYILLVIPKSEILNLKFTNNETICNELKNKKQ